ncbi:MAG: redoxin domain-containing protein [Anaerolineaceae bacterium]|nr:redoxin domain-containing protein [Anaerolineaceae bacterium]
MEIQLSLWLAFIAGLVSFISPCVLPLVPAYVGYMGGRLTSSVSNVALAGGPVVGIGTAQRFITFAHSLFFVAGFSLVFVGIGLVSTAFISVVGGQNIGTITDLIGRVGGVIIIFLGLHFSGLLSGWLQRLRSSESLLASPLFGLAVALIAAGLILWGFSGTVAIQESDLWQWAPWAPTLGLILLALFLAWLLLGGAFTDGARFWRANIDRLTTFLYADMRREVAASGGRNGFASSALMGVVFSAGWTPCIGPVYGAVLTLAANGGDVSQASILLAAYSLGLGAPFMLTAFLLDGAQGILRRLQRHLRSIQLLSGAFLVLVGLLVASGTLQGLSATLATGAFAEAAINLEEQVLGSLIGEPGAESQGDVDALSAADAPAGFDQLAANAPSTGTAVGQIAPDFATTGDDGQALSLGDYRGQVVLLNFWATWCGPCRIEMPEFEQIYRERAGEDFVVIAVNNAESAAAVQDFREELALSFPLALDVDASIQALFGISNYPSTFLLDGDGRILSRHFGALTVEQIHELVDGALVS